MVTTKKIKSKSKPKWHWTNRNWDFGAVIVALLGTFLLLVSLLSRPQIVILHHSVVITQGLVAPAIIMGAIVWSIIELFTPPGRTLEDLLIRIIPAFVIGGVVGLLSTYISLRAHRREKHLEEHKENLRSLKGALINGKSHLWPFTNGAEDISLPTKYEISSVLDTGISFIISNLVPVYTEDNVYSVDKVLYKDITNHFPKLFNRLIKTDNNIKENARTIYKELNKISLSIYRNLNKINPDISLMYPNAAPKESSDGISKLRFNEAIDYYQYFVAGDVFLFAIKENEDAWPRGIKYLKQIGLYSVFKNIGDAVNNEMKIEIKEMLELQEKLFSDIDSCINEIEKVLHQTKLKGRCELA